MTIIYTDGSYEEKAVHIEAISGDLKQLDSKHHAHAAKTFPEQFELKTTATDRDISDLAEILEE